MQGGESRPEGRLGTTSTAEAPGGSDAAPRDDAAIPAQLAKGRARTRMSRFARWALVVPLLILWIVGWVTPIVPGFPFLLVALFLMSPDFPPARRLATKLQRKFPFVRRTIPKRWRVTKDRDP